MIIGLGVLAMSLAGGAVWWYLDAARTDSNDVIHRWLTEPDSRPALHTDNAQPCPGAPFMLPSPGLVGLLWRDPARPYNVIRRHTGIDVFGDGPSGTVPVVAVYDGYLTRLDEWVSTVIIRHDDPLQPGRIIWSYYTHLAGVDGQPFISDEFPPGTSEVFVEQGTLLGYQGDYSGGGPNVAVHVHLSLVQTGDDGRFKNEGRLRNTLDPSPYFGLPLNIDDHPDRPIRC
jgi:hypothetical protein